MLAGRERSEPPGVMGESRSGFMRRGGRRPLERASAAAMSMEMLLPEREWPSGVARPGVARPGEPRTGVFRPEEARPGVDRPGVARTGVFRPGVDRPGVAKPGVDLPEVGVWRAVPGRLCVIVKRPLEVRDSVGWGARGVLVPDSMVFG